MKYCRLCELEFPEGVLFCPKCGRNLEQVQAKDGESASAFTPSGDYDADQSPLERKQYSPEPPPDYETCMKREIEKAEKITESGILDHAQYPEEHPEITQNEIIERQKKPCARCGTLNSHYQTFCIGCGAEIDAGGLPSAQGVVPQHYISPATPPTDSTPPTPPPAPYAAPTPPPAPAYAQHPESNPAITGYSPGDYQSTLHLGGNDRTRKNSFLDAISSRSAWTWVGLIAAVIIISAAAWFFFYGGKSLLFNSENKNMRRAETVMSELPSYEYTINATFDSAESGQFIGDGKLLNESPDRTSWAINIHAPSGKIIQPRGLQIGKDQYFDFGNGWKFSSPGTETISAHKLWTGYYNIENLGDQNLNGYTCYHYKYKVPSRIFATPIGMSNSQGIGDAVMEIWIDAETKRIIRMNAKVYYLLVGGVKANAAITMDLSGTGLSYQIKPPVK